MTKSTGKFITIEGIEGVGKTTARNFIEQYLKGHQVEYVLTREPGGTPIAEDVRQLLLKNHDEIMSPDAELLLLFAGRAQNISQVIRPALQRGKWVVSDRFTDASFAYQGGGRNIPQKHIASLADWVQGDLQPHLTLLLDAPVEIALKRMAGRGEKDRIESEATAFFERVRQQYLSRAEQFSDRFHIIDATQGVNQVQQCIAAAIDLLINE